MGNILGEPFKPYVQNQINKRQIVHGGNKYADEIYYLNSRNAWIKLASGVSIDEKRMKLLEGNPLVEGVPLGSSLAKGNILFNGLTSNANDRDTVGKDLRSGVSSDETDTPAYGVGGFGGIDGNFGYSPLPGIIEASLTTLNRGSIKKAKVTIKCYNKYQFDIIDILFLRLGFSVFLEFGVSHYYDNEDNFTTRDPSLINEDYFFNTSFDKSNYSKWLPLIEEKRKETGGNYEGVFGVISNFSWNFESDGSYIINMEIMSHGDVIESLKVNLPPINQTTLSPIELQNQQREIRQSLADRNKNQVLGHVIINQDQFYDETYPGLKKTIEDWYKNAINPASNVLALDYTFNPGIGTKFEIKIEGASLPPYSFPGGTNLQNLSKDKLEKEINSTLKPTLERAIQFSLDSAGSALGGAVWSNIWNILSGDFTSQIKKVWDNSGLGDEAFIEQSFLTVVALQEAFFPNSEDVGLSNPTFGGIGYGNTFESGQSQDANNIPGSNEYGKEAIEIFEKLYNDVENSGPDSQEKNIKKQRLLLQYAQLDNILFNVYAWYYSLYLRITLFDDDDDVSLGDEDARSEGDADNSIGETQREKDLEQKGKNRIREYLYNLRYFDTISAADNDLLNQQNIRESYEKLKSDTFKSNIEKKDEYENIIDLSEYNKTPEKYSELIPITTINPNINQRTYLDTTQAVQDEDIQKRKNELSQMGEPQINKNIKAWNDAGLFPFIKPGSTQVDIVSLDINEPEYSYFIRLGTFLDFLQERVIPKIPSGEQKGQPIITIDTNPETNICYVTDCSISFDPKKFISRHDNFSFQGDNLATKPTIYNELNEFIGKTGGGYMYGKIMNIYVNFNRIQELFDKVDDHNKVDLFEILKTLSNDINECYGGLNNIEPIVTDQVPLSGDDIPEEMKKYFKEEDYSCNTIQFIDQTNIPGIEQIAKKTGLSLYDEENYIFDIYGFRNNSNPNGDNDLPENYKTSTFVQEVGLTTQIDKNYATMITIGATANGEIPGDNATAFSKWNVGLTDRFKNNIIDAVADTGSLASQNELIVRDYNSMVDIKNYIGLLGFNDDFTINKDFIETQISTYNNFYTYLQALETQKSIDNNLTGLGNSSVGFLPFNLKLKMDGIGGIKIYNRIKIDTKFLPSNYPETLMFIVTGIDHTISNNQWVTNLSTLATSKGVLQEPNLYQDSSEDLNTDNTDSTNNTQSVSTDEVLKQNKNKTKTPSQQKQEQQEKKDKVQQQQEQQNPQVSNVKEEDSQTLGTSSGPITNPNAYKTSTELEAAIKKGLDVIDNIPSNITNAYKDLRKRILRVAASYVGQLEEQPNKGFLNPDFEEMYKSIKWKPGLEWCNYSVWLWWYQAFTVGNSYVSSTPNYPNTFDSPKRHSMHPANIKEAKSNFKYAVKPSSVDSQPPGSGLFRGFMDPGTVNSKNHFQKIKRFVPVNLSQSKLKLAISQHKVLPGDAVYFDWAKRKPGYSDTSHIGIYLCPGDINCTSIWTLEGNATPDGNKKIQGVFKKHRKNPSYIRGFGRLFTSGELSSKNLYPKSNV